MKVRVEDMRFNRSSLTREFGVAGVPLLQGHTHVPFLLRGKYEEDWEGSTYADIVSASKKGGQRHNPGNLWTLRGNIFANGVKELVTGWLLEDGTFEVFSGHHRAILAWSCGRTELEVECIDPDPYAKMKPAELVAVRKVYAELCEHENVRSGWCYNPVPGLEAHRPTALKRLRLMYPHLVDCRGDRLLDLGCNDGYFGHALSQHDFVPTFVDRSRWYLDVVRTKMAISKREHCVAHISADDFLRDVFDGFAAVLYTDVFYHTVLERGKFAAFMQLDRVLDRADERLIFSPGRWDKLRANGVTPVEVFAVVRKKARQVRYLGQDDDRNYHRELYAVYR